jgi:UDP-N-acetylglucosamine 4,6-dehydratase
LISQTQKVLITGGTGSFGRAYVRALLEQSGSRVCVVSRDELKQSELRQEMGADPRLTCVLADVRDPDKLRRVFLDHRPELVVHAAALKQVPACERDPEEAVRTNVLGAVHVVEAALEAGVPRIIALSTDKAAAPINAYGRSKAMAESIFLRANDRGASRGVRFGVVRYGNVVASRGSVVPLFLEAQRLLKPIAITDLRMTRFWMAIGEAVRLVQYASAHLQGGEVFVPAIPSRKVVDVARSLAPDCPIEEVGIRPGEKLHETLITEDEARHTVVRTDVDGSRLYVIEPDGPTWPFRSRGTRVPAGFTLRSDSPTPLVMALPCELAGVA